jgi:hypothetical protein
VAVSRLQATATVVATTTAVPGVVAVATLRSRSNCSSTDGAADDAEKRMLPSGGLQGAAAAF